MLLLMACAATEPQLVEVGFTVEAATISGTPFGLDDSYRTATGSGRFAWDLRVDDMDWDDESRGTYQHTRESVFELEFQGVEVDGSGTARVEVEDFDPDTFRFEDGIPFVDDGDGLPGPMLVAGEEREDVELWFAITEDAGTAFDGDALPEALPPVLLDPELPHTFSLQDEDGTLLFQLLTIEQR